MSAWPSTLPLPTLQGYGVKPDAAFVRTDMDAGAARQRRRYTAPPSRLSVAWVFTAAQMASFKTFYETTLDLGSGWFTLDINAGAGLASKDCRFVEPYQASLSGNGVWAVSATLEVRGA